MTQALTGTRFGSIEFLLEDVFTFPEGLIGFPHLTRFLLVSHSENSPFTWLQSIDEPALAFLTTDPTNFILDFALEIRDEEAENLELTDETPSQVLTTVSIPRGEPESMSLNLAGPIIINLATKVGKQVVVEGEPTQLKRSVLKAPAAA